jgi:hypothetical protein
MTRIRQILLEEVLSNLHEFCCLVTVIQFLAIYQSIQYFFLVEVNTDLSEV